MLQLTSGQLFLHGGGTSSGFVGVTYISTDMNTWVTKASSQNTRKYHACAEHAGYIWLGGGRDDGTTEKYELSTNSWTYGTDLPNYAYWPGEFLSHAGVLTYAGGYGNKNIYQLNMEQNGWIQVFKRIYNYVIMNTLSDRRNVPEKKFFSCPFYFRECLQR